MDYSERDRYKLKKTNFNKDVVSLNFILAPKVIPVNRNEEKVSWIYGEISMADNFPKFSTFITIFSLFRNQVLCKLFTWQGTIWIINETTIALSPVFGFENFSKQMKLKFRSITSLHDREFMRNTWTFSTVDRWSN